MTGRGVWSPDFRACWGERQRSRRGHPSTHRDPPIVLSERSAGACRRGVTGVIRRCCMKTLCGGRTSRDPPQEPHHRDAVEFLGQVRGCSCGGGVARRGPTVGLAVRGSRPPGLRAGGVSSPVSPAGPARRALTRCRLRPIPPEALRGDGRAATPTLRETPPGGEAPPPKTRLKMPAKMAAWLSASSMRGVRSGCAEGDCRQRARVARAGHLPGLTPFTTIGVVWLNALSCHGRSCSPARWPDAARAGPSRRPVRRAAGPVARTRRGASGASPSRNPLRLPARLRGPGPVGD